MNLDLIATALRDLTGDASLSPEALQCLRDEACIQNLAKAIESGANRTEFTTVIPAPPEIAEAIYNDLRGKLNKKTIKTSNGSTIIVAKRGRLGGLRLVQLDENLPSVPVDQKSKEGQIETKAKEINDEELKLEKSYYPLVQVWAKRAGYEGCEVTGGKIPGLKWENPDLVSADYEVSKFSRSIRFYVVSFEVKLKVEPEAVWQAAHYRQFSNEVYLAFARDEEEIRSRHDGRIFEMAVELGLGVLCFDRQKQEFREIQSPRVTDPAASKAEYIVANFASLLRPTLDAACKEHNECFKISFS